MEEYRETSEVKVVVSTTRINKGRTPGECSALMVEAWRLRRSVRSGVGVNRVVNQRTHEVSTVRSPAAASSLKMTNKERAEVDDGSVGTWTGMTVAWRTDGIGRRLPVERKSGIVRQGGGNRFQMANTVMPHLVLWLALGLVSAIGAVLERRQRGILEALFCPDTPTTLPSTHTIHSRGIFLSSSTNHICLYSVGVRF